MPKKLPSLSEIGSKGISIAKSIPLAATVAIPFMEILPDVKGIINDPFNEAAWNATTKHAAHVFGGYEEGGNISSGRLKQTYAPIAIAGIIRSLLDYVV